MDSFGRNVARHLRVMCVCQLEHSCSLHFSCCDLIFTWNPVLQWTCLTTSFPWFKISRPFVYFFTLFLRLQNKTFLSNWSHIQLESICIVQSRSVLFLAGWEGILCCVNRLANCAWPLTESVIACVLEYFAWLVGGSALEPALLQMCFKSLLHLSSICEGIDDFVSDITPDNLIFTHIYTFHSSHNAFHMAPMDSSGAFPIICWWHWEYRVNSLNLCPPRASYS